MPPGLEQSAEVALPGSCQKLSSWALVAVACAAVGLAQPASARHRTPIPNTDPARDAELVVDCAKGTVLYARNEAVERHPASLTKMMTLYIMFERLRAGKLKMGTVFSVSPNAASQPKAKLHLKAGSTITVENAIEAIVILSANDVAVTVAENIGGTESHFTELMNADAQALGMTHTFYHNASGLPDSLQLTTASDLAILARHLVYDFPEYFHYFRMTSFSFNARTFDTHDGLLNSYQGADGMKTGYTDQSGYNLVTTASRDGVRLIGVVIGGVSAERRNREMEKLLNDAFAKVAQKANPSTSVTAPAVVPAATPGKRASATN
jgi:D-alanyl-D-alanine carboxypeptidase